MKSRVIVQILSVFFLILIFIGISSCDDCIEGNGKISTRTANLPEINSISLDIDANVVLVNDTLGEVKIEGESNLIEAITLNRNGKNLKIESEKCFISHKPVTLFIPIKVISSLQINGSGDIKSTYKLSATELKLKINGSGNIDIQVDASNLYSEINGSGDIIINGSAQNHKVEINGSGNVKAEGFPTGDIRILINGSGDCYAMATTALAVKIRGSGSIYYSGNPDITSDIKGSGSIEKTK